MHAYWPQLAVAIIIIMYGVLDLDQRQLVTSLIIVEFISSS